MMTDYEAYTNYLALKLHFSGNYDYFKYNGKVSASVESFKKRKDKYQFLKLSKKLSNDEIIDYYVANFIRDKKWIGEFEQQNWTEHKRIQQSLEYNFKNDIEKLLTNIENFDILFESNIGKHPILLKAYLGKKINLETLVILEKVLQFKNKFDQQITETFIWPKVSRLISKYDPFVKINIREYRMKTFNIVKEIF